MNNQSEILGQKNDKCGVRHKMSRIESIYEESDRSDISENKPSSEEELTVFKGAQRDKWKKVRGSPFTLEFALQVLHHHRGQIYYLNITQNCFPVLLGCWVAPAEKRPRNASMNERKKI